MQLGISIVISSIIDASLKKKNLQIQFSTIYLSVVWDKQSYKDFLLLSTKYQIYFVYP